jgi:hypothetical protein
MALQISFHWRHAAIAVCVALAAGSATAAASRKAAAAPANTAAPAMSVSARAALTHVVQTRDNANAPFVLIDKRDARLWVFDAQGRPAGNTPVLLGLARGDDTVPGIGDKPLAQVKRSERTTPAGRFVAEPGRNGRGEDVIWVDYDAAVSMHRVHNVHAWERREQRLRTPTIADNRISYGCINVPTKFYDQVLKPTVGRAHPVVYLLPETRAVASIFKPEVSSHHAALARFD